MVHAGTFSPVVYQLRVTLEYIDLPIWRRLHVPGRFTLAQLRLVAPRHQDRGRRRSRHRHPARGARCAVCVAGERACPPERFDLDLVNRRLGHVLR